MNILIEWIYRIPKGPETVFRSEEMPAAQALLFAEDLERTKRAKSISFIDRFDSTWTVKEMKGYLKGIETEPHNVSVYFDGGYDIATSKSGLGCVIYYEQSGKSYRLRQNAPSAELTSNNEAEYAALYLGLQELELLNVHHLPVRFIGDSQVVINQLTGEWPVLENILSGWADRIDDKLKDLGIQPEYELVQRKLNSEADRLATQALNGVSITATSEIPVN
ncbi:reverse transcriptase-like protein [Sporosarcina sp. ANT_H38]|uniref:ribonuclease H family protein n=1 Tax=Sporosarcina sp. ANT_H38 TaxID=2597358 RepID=UPI0011F25080|nr:ribonuclease H family protein [Sporosarcina sp. ANT_H38]KAA0966302.1 reverse transcriptase-like protein [Sporosarcina sp. ANT_H38]